MKVKLLDSNSLSFYRTFHQFKHYGEFQTLEEFMEHLKYARDRKLKLYILGNGSNTLFGRKKVKSLVLKNKLAKELTPLPNNMLHVTSSCLLIDVLKYCYDNSLDSFYYLASVPATIGGALAMNAGRGHVHNRTIYDFVDEITFYDSNEGSVKTLSGEEVVLGYRETMFTGIHSNLILSTVFKFSKAEFDTNPIMERCKWSKVHQDYSAPNCGSVFKETDYKLLNSLKGFSLGGASFSKKTCNWILNQSNNPVFILYLIRLVQLFHFLRGRKAILELIVVD